MTPSNEVAKYTHDLVLQPSLDAMLGQFVAWSNALTPLRAPAINPHERQSA